MNGILLTTTTCPKCPAMKAWIKENINFEVQLIDETHPEFSDLLMEYGVTTAPTFIILEKGEEIFRGNEDYEIEEFLKNL